jgi:oxygen-independent coproporphyrinogen III oxidase
MDRASSSVYIHIPFCIHRCAYCDFNTYAGIEASIPAYVEALRAEIKSLGCSAGVRLPVHSIFFGGGTPSLLQPGELESILYALDGSFDLHPEIEKTIEANPGTVSFDYQKNLIQMGFNRLSLGMQSAHPNDLRVLERNHDLLEVVKAVQSARKAGFSNINLDLIFGIPGQTMESWSGSISMALSLLPEHLSLYALTLEHGTPMAHWVERGLLPSPDTDLAADMYDLACEKLDAAGFEQYEISNWARRDYKNNIKVCQHNLQYWRLLPYIGIGAGAHGFIDGVRTVGVLSPAAYIKRLKKPDCSTSFPVTPATISIHKITPEEEMGEFMMMGLRLVHEGISAATFEKRFGLSLEAVYLDEIKKFTGNGLLCWDQNTLKLTSRGRLLGNQVFQAFI